MQSFRPAPLTVSSLFKNAGWNPKQHLLALCWASLIQKAFITEHAEGKKGPDVIEFGGPDFGRDSNIFLISKHWD